jgi:hypothetical protein
MKVRLLKKIRKRFYWYRKYSAGAARYYLYDNKKITDYHVCYYHEPESNNKLIHEIMRKMGWGHIYNGFVSEHKYRKRQREAFKLKSKYKQHFNK